MRGLQPRDNNSSSSSVGGSGTACSVGDSGAACTRAVCMHLRWCFASWALRYVFVRRYPRWKQCVATAWEICWCVRGDCAQQPQQDSSIIVVLFLYPSAAVLRAHSFAMKFFVLKDRFFLLEALYYCTLACSLRAPNMRPTSLCFSKAEVLLPMSPAVRVEPRQARFSARGRPCTVLPRYLFQTHQQTRMERFDLVWYRGSRGPEENAQRALPEAVSKLCGALHCAGVDSSATQFLLIRWSSKRRQHAGRADK